MEQLFEVRLLEFSQPKFHHSFQLHMLLLIFSVFSPIPSFIFISARDRKREHCCKRPKKDPVNTDESETLSNIQVAYR